MTDLRVGVVLSEPDVPRWHATAIEEIERLGFCSLTVFSCQSRARGPRGRLLYDAYVRADRRVFGRPGDPLARVPARECGRAGTRRVRLDGEPASERSLAAIAAEQLDVLLCLAPEVPADRLAGSARHGAWCLYAGGLRGRAGEALLFWQMADEDFVAPITLRAHTLADGERIIYRSVVESDRLSLHRSRCRAARRGAQLPARRLRDLRELGWASIASEAVHGEPQRSAPSNATMVRFLWRVTAGAARRQLAGRLGEKQWFIAYRRTGAERLTLIAPPAGRFYADPFLFQRDGRRFIFFEDYDGSCGRAAICYVELDETGRHRAPRPALSQDCHLSYPFVFEDGDAVYMLPETAGRRTVELYRAVRFPGEWTLDRVLLTDVSATDATLLRHDGRLWMFVAMAVDGGRPIDELFLFSSDSLGGEWEPHPMNPVVSDVRRARPGGRIFMRDGQLVRPGQDCSRAYGWRLVFNRIEALSRSEYRERPVSAIEPAPESGNLRTHSYGSDGTFEVLDGFRMRPRLSPAPMARPRWYHVDLESPGRERSILHS